MFETDVLDPIGHRQVLEPLVDSFSQLALGLVPG
jgi:hypothetical protein